MGFYHGEYCANEGAMPPEIRGQSELYALEAKLYIEHILNQLP